MSDNANPLSRALRGALLQERFPELRDVARKIVLHVGGATIEERALRLEVSHATYKRLYSLAKGKP